MAVCMICRSGSTSIPVVVMLYVLFSSPRLLFTHLLLTCQLIEAAGSDATELFNEVGHSQEARERMEEFQLGVVATETRFTGSEYAERSGEV